MEHIPEFEDFLREFQPRRPRVLPDIRGGPRRHLRLAANAVVLLSVAASVWFVFRQSGSQRESPGGQHAASNLDLAAPSTPLKMIPLTRLAMEDPNFEAVLDEASRHVLPNFRNADSTLLVLAKE